MRYCASSRDASRANGTYSVMRVINAAWPSDIVGESVGTGDTDLRYSWLVDASVEPESSRWG